MIYIILLWMYTFIPFDDFDFNGLLTYKYGMFSGTMHFHFAFALTHKHQWLVNGFRDMESCVAPILSTRTSIYCFQFHVYICIYIFLWMYFLRSFYSFKILFRSSSIKADTFFSFQMNENLLMRFTFRHKYNHLFLWCSQLCPAHGINHEL